MRFPKAYGSCFQGIGLEVSLTGSRASTVESPEISHTLQQVPPQDRPQSLCAAPESWCLSCPCCFLPAHRASPCPASPTCSSCLPGATWDHLWPWHGELHLPLRLGSNSWCQTQQLPSAPLLILHGQLGCRGGPVSEEGEALWGVQWKRAFPWSLLTIFQVFTGKKNWDYWIWVVCKACRLIGWSNAFFLIAVVNKVFKARKLRLISAQCLE